MGFVTLYCLNFEYPRLPITVHGEKEEWVKSVPRRSYWNAI